MDIRDCESEKNDRSSEYELKLLMPAVTEGILLKHKGANENPFKLTGKPLFENVRVNITPHEAKDEEDFDRRE